jgi:hypothetical protein
VSKSKKPSRETQRLLNSLSILQDYPNSTNVTMRGTKDKPSKSRKSSKPLEPSSSDAGNKASSGRSSRGTQDAPAANEAPSQSLGKRAAPEPAADATAVAKKRRSKKQSQEGPDAELQENVPPKGDVAAPRHAKAASQRSGSAGGPPLVEAQPSQANAGAGSPTPAAAKAPEHSRAKRKEKHGKPTGERPCGDMAKPAAPAAPGLPLPPLAAGPEQPAAPPPPAAAPSAQVPQQDPPPAALPRAAPSDKRPSEPRQPPSAPAAAAAAAPGGATGPAGGGPAAAGGSRREAGGLPVTGTTPVKAFAPPPLPRLDDVGRKERAAVVELQVCMRTCVPACVPLLHSTTAGLHCMCVASACATRRAACAMERRSTRCRLAKRVAEPRALDAASPGQARASHARARLPALPCLPRCCQ